MAFQLERYKINVFQTVFYGAAVRVNAIIGFVATVKCVIWMADPESIPGLLARSMPAVPWFNEFVLVAIPAAIFLAQALLQSQHDKSSSCLQHLVANSLTKMALVKTLEAADPQAGKTVRAEGEIQALPKHYRNILVIEAKLLSVISMTLVLASVLMAGFFVHWKIMGVMLFAGLLCSLAFFIYQHRTSREKEDQVNKARDQESKALKNINNLFHQRSTGTEAPSAVSYPEVEWVGDLALSKIAEKSINAQSAFLMNLGQAAIVAVFLLTVLSMAMDDLSLGSIAILAIIFRFILGYALVIVRDVSYLLASRHKLIAVKNKCL